MIQTTFITFTKPKPIDLLRYNLKELYYTKFKSSDDNLYNIDSDAFEKEKVITTDTR